MVSKRAAVATWMNENAVCKKNVRYVQLDKKYQKLCSSAWRKPNPSRILNLNLLNSTRHLSKSKASSLTSSILQNSRSTTGNDFKNLNIFQSDNILSSDCSKWICNHPSSEKSVGFAYCDITSQCVDNKYQSDFIGMRSNFLNWTRCDRENRYEICYQDKIWALKNMYCTKVLKNVRKFPPVAKRIQVK